MFPKHCFMTPPLEGFSTTEARTGDRIPAIGYLAGYFGKLVLEFPKLENWKQMAGKLGTGTPQLCTALVTLRCCISRRFSPGALQTRYRT